MTTRCPTCGGSGQVPWVPPPDGGSYGFGKWPTEPCRSCGGSGWVEQSAPTDKSRLTGRSE